MIELFRVVYWRNDIEKVEATRVSESSYWHMVHGRERRRSLCTAHDAVFPTYTEAWQHLHDCLTRKRAGLMKQISTIDEALAMLAECPPEVTD